MEKENEREKQDFVAAGEEIGPEEAGGGGDAGCSPVQHGPGEETVVTGEEPQAVSGEETAEDEKARYEKLLADEKARAEDYLSRLVRMQADFENYRKRVAREREELVKYSGEQLITALLPVLDNFDLALHAQNNNYENLLSGVEMISRQLTDILAREGLEVIPAVGLEFNPEFHEAVMKEESGEHPENTVTAELRRGFTYKGKVIRPAMVKVAG
jgi:molecular chaperone GrpE